MVSSKGLVEASKQRVENLKLQVRGGDSTPRQGRLMKEWLSIEPTYEHWRSRQRAMRFVGRKLH
jgi:hypothetical protein